MRVVMNHFVSAGTGFKTPKGRSLVRTNRAAWDVADDWLLSHPWRQNALWVQYASQSKVADVDQFITRSVRWLNKTTTVATEPGRIAGVKTAMVAAFVVGIPGQQDDPRIHSHAVLLCENRISTKAVQKRYKMGMSSVRLYQPELGGLRYALSGHHLLINARGFQPRRSLSNVDDLSLERLTLHHRLRL